MCIAPFKDILCSVWCGTLTRQELLLLKMTEQKLKKYLVMRTYGCILFIGMISLAKGLQAQSGPFLKAGKIEYERKLNVMT